MKKSIYALCTKTGGFESLLCLEENQIIAESADEVDGDGVYYVEWHDMSGEHSSYFLEKIDINPFN